MVIVRAEHEVGRLLADHDRRRVRVAADDARHDRGVGDPEPAQAVDAERMPASGAVAAISRASFAPTTRCSRSSGALR